MKKKTNRTTAKCQHCGVNYEVSLRGSHTAKYCSSRCKMAASRARRRVIPFGYDCAASRKKAADEAKASE